MEATDKSFNHPADCGRRLLPTLIDHTAATDPTKPFAALPISTDIRDGFRDVDYRCFAGAINRCCHWLEHEFGPPVHKFEKVAYITEASDIRYAIFIIAAIKAGYVALLLSPRNSVEEHLSLLEAGRCSKIVTPKVQIPVLMEVVLQRPMTSVTMLEIDYWLKVGGSTGENEYPFTRSFEDARLEPFVAVHTSGSTGAPKLVVASHGTFAAQDAFQTIPALGGGPVNVHLLEGVILACNVYSEMTIVLPPTLPLTAEVCDLVHSYGSVDGTCLPPSILVDISNNSQYMDRLGRLDFIAYGGGPLPTEAGDHIASTGKPLLNLFGSSETSMLPGEILDSTDWKYLKYSQFLGHEFREVGDGLSELVIVRKPELDPFQGVFCTFPSKTEYPMSDVYEPHPTKPDLWLYKGRVDDVIIFSNGETFNPLVMEGIISSHPAVKSALVAGQGRFQAALLIEPKTNEVLAAGSMIEEVWPTVEKANKQCATQGAIMKEFILITSSDKPMLRASKGTVRRKPTLELYAEELQTLYTADISLELPSNLTPLDFKSHEQVRSVIRRLASTLLGVEELDDTTSFFDLGLNSLKALSLTKLINGILKASNTSVITNQTILSNPSVTSLAEALITLGSHENPSKDRQSEVARQYQEMDDLLQRYMPRLDDHIKVSTDKTMKENTPHVVILTGSTGSLGSYLLDTLISNSTVGKIYCFNRGINSGQRQTASQSQKGLPTDFSKVDFLQWDPSQPYLGLKGSAYQYLRDHSTHIIHNAWQVNFNLPLKSFEPHLAGVQHLVEFAACSYKRARLFFISTIGTVINYSDSTDRISEVEILDNDWTTAAKAGYPQSKLVAERMLANASRKNNIRVTIGRVGQIAGPSKDKGMWARQEWLPSLITSSKYLGLIPESMGYLDHVDWIPVDLVTDIIGELAFVPEVERVYHIVNPQRTTWQSLLPTILQHLDPQGIEVTAFEHWLRELQKSAGRVEDVERNPAVKLLPFFADVEKGMREGKKPVVLDTKCAEKSSQILRTLKPTGQEWMGQWMRQWGF
ncbi:MAG: hypothetical protein Q9219_005528 [cf. Caloplaca sp. 3 TL-2023]